MAKFSGINNILAPSTSTSKVKQSKEEAQARRKERGQEYLASLISGIVEVIRYNTKERKTFKKTKKANPAELLEVLRKALNCGVTVADIRHAQQAAYDKNGEYTFLAKRFPWTHATAAILEGFKDEHHLDVATILGFNVVATPAEVEEAVTQPAPPKAAPKAKRNRKAS